ncbi:DUF983 domain-containing protein [Phyllobacterium sp. YR531]|uniref:DUF983 domain-containing protein n=1 Tax=Phyllobacterium sp. YR531 TaxID=1144343 RepID=UPI00026FBAAB|nr:DUF983 domain-containing protein [Phyllobacterium sp. YR531]EJN04812.1 hypothetical protein PMI41_01277 [Phyllobacterium sp. YR531]
MTEQFIGNNIAQTRPRRPIGQAMWRGFLGRCPHCGKGKLFRAFVKSVDNCSVCGEDYTHHQADDFPAYITITIVGHIVLGGFLATETLLILSNWAHLAIWVPLTIIMSIALLQPVKGAIIGLQWANYMHGFGEHSDPKPSE